MTECSWWESILPVSVYLPSVQHIVGSQKISVLSSNSLKGSSLAFWLLPASPVQRRPVWFGQEVLLLWPLRLCDSQLDTEQGKGHTVAKARWLFLNPIPFCCQPTLKYNPSLNMIDVFELGSLALEEWRKEIEYQPSLLPETGSLVTWDGNSLENGVTAQISA